MTDHAEIAEELLDSLKNTVVGTVAEPRRIGEAQVHAGLATAQGIADLVAVGEEILARLDSIAANLAKPQVRVDPAGLTRYIRERYGEDGPAPGSAMHAGLDVACELPGGNAKPPMHADLYRRLADEGARSEHPDGRDGGR